MNKQAVGLWVVVCVLLVLDICVHCVRAQVGIAPAKVLQVQELQVLNSQGKVAIDLVAKADEPAVQLRDSKGRRRLVLAADDGGGQVMLEDTEDKTRLSLDGSSNPAFLLWHQGTIRSSLAAPSDGGSALAFYDSSGQERSELGCFGSEGNENRLSFYDGAGKTRAELGYLGGTRDEAHLTLLNEDDPKGAKLYVNHLEAGLDVFGANGKPRAGIDYVLNGPPMVYVTDKRGNDIWSETGQRTH